MMQVYNLQDLITLGTKVKFSTKVELFKHRISYEQALISKNSAIICDNTVYIKIIEFINAVNSAELPESTKNDIIKTINKIPGKKIDTTNCIIITTVSVLESAFGKPKINNHILNDDHVFIMEPNTFISLVPV